MAAIPVPFSPDIIHSYTRLQDYLVGPAKDKLVENQVLDASRQCHMNWLGRWNAIPLSIAEPFITIYSVFLKTIGNLLYYSGFESYGLYIYLAGYSAEIDYRYDEYMDFGENYLAHASNVYSPACADLYALPNMKAEEIKSARVRSVLQRKELNFEVPNALCRGESLWLIRAYLKTRHLFANHRQHLQALGSLFYHGAPQEAALIQKMCATVEFLKLKEHSAKHVPIALKHGKMDERACKNAFIQMAKNLKPGAYYFRVPKHGMAYICTGDGKGYWFDPNGGMKAIRSNIDFDTLANTIVNYYSNIHRLPKDSAKDWKDHIAEFYRMDLA